MRDRSRQLPHRRDTIGVRQRLSFFLRTSAFCHIHHGPDEFDHVAGRVENRVADGLDLSNLAARKHNSIGYVEISLFEDCCPEVFCSASPIIRMEAPSKFFKSRQPCCGIKTLQPERFLGPIGDFARRRDHRPTARVAQSLRFR